MKPIKKGYEFLLENPKDNENVDRSFRIYKKMDEIGRYLFDDLYNILQKDEKSGKYAFYLNDTNKNIGLMPQLFGCVGLLNMISRFKIKVKDDEKNRIYDLLDLIFEYIGDKNKYDISPYVDDSVNKRVFAKHRFIMTETWALSLFVMMRQLQNLNIMSFKKEHMDKAKDGIKFIIKDLLNSVVGVAGKPEGWAYSTQRDLPPSLYITHAVLETYSDIDDCILGDETKKDDEIIEYVGKDIDDDEYYIYKFKDLCEKIGDRTWHRYKKVLRNEFIDDKFTGEFQNISKDNLFITRRSNSLFNTLFVINILFYSYENVRNQEEKDDVILLYKLAFQNLTNVYDELQKANRENSVEKYLFYFEGDDENTKLLNENVLQMETLMPMMVSTLNKIALYVYKYPQQDMTNLFDSILEKKADDKWLWEKNRYDLLVTQRYETAFLSYFEYYEAYERNYATTRNEIDAIREEVKKEVRLDVENKIRDEFQKKLQEDIAKEKLKISESFIIENEINKRIDEKINNNTLEIVNSVIETAIKYNKATAQQKKSFFENEANKRFYDNLNEYAKSILYTDIKNIVDDGDEEKIASLESDTINDIKTFIKKYVEFNARNTNRTNKIQLSSILEVLESYITAINRYNNSHKDSKIDLINGFDKIINS